MGAYAYCSCGEELDLATFTDAVIGEQACPQCGEKRRLDDWERRYRIDDACALLGRLFKAAGPVNAIEQSHLDEFERTFGKSD